MLKKEQNFEMELTKARELIITAPVEAEKLLRKLLRWKISVKNELETKIELAYSLWAQGKNKESQQMYEEVYERASELELEEEKADALEGLAGVDIDLGELKRGTDRCHQAIKIFQKLKNKEKEAKTSNTLAIIHFTKGELEEALKWFKKTRRLAKDTQSLTIAHVLSNMGLIHHARGEFEKAAKYYAESVELSRSLKSARGICITQNNLGDALQQMGEYVEAHKNYEQALQLARDTKDKKNIALLSQSLANLLVDLGELKKAYPLFKTAVKIYDDVGEATGRIRAYIGLAYYWLIKGQLEKAKRILQDALQIIEETGVIESQVEVLVSLAETTVGLNEIDEAYAYLKQANKLALERASDLEQASVLIQRGRINVNELEFNEAEILLEEARWLAGKINQLNLQFRADMLLAQNFLMRYLQDTTKSHYYEQALSLNTEAMLLAKERKLIPNYVDALIIQGLLYSLQGDFENAKSSLSEALTLAKEKGMTVQVQQAKERLSIISGKQLNIASNEHLRSIVLALAMDQLKRATATYVESTISEEDLAETFLVSFRVDEIEGPTILEGENIDLTDPYRLGQLTQIGVLYAISLGMGHGYHEGLFGPVPFGKSLLRAVIYARMLPDPTQKDPRSRGKSYVLFSLVFPQKMIQFFYDRKKLDQLFETQINKLKDATEIDQKFLTNLREKILSAFMTELTWESEEEEI